MWAAGSHHRAVVDTPRVDVLDLARRLVTEHWGGESAWVNASCALGPLEHAGRALPLTAPRDGHLLALVRPYQLGDLNRDLHLVLAHRGRELAMPIVTSDLDRARDLVQRLTAACRQRRELRDPLPWKHFLGERAAGTAGGPDRSTPATQLEDELRGVVESRQRLDQIELYETMLDNGGLDVRARRRAERTPAWR